MKHVRHFFIDGSNADEDNDSRDSNSSDGYLGDISEGDMVQHRAIRAQYLNTERGK